MKREPKDDLADVVREETHRGRRGVTDTKARRWNQELREGFRELLREGNAEKFRAAIVALGHEPGTPAFDSLLRLWREYQRRR